MTPDELDAGSTGRYIQYSEELKIAISEIRFGARSDFGFHKPFRFFDFPASRSESPTTGFGMGSGEIGPTVNSLRIIQLAGPERVPHNSLVAGSSPTGPTNPHRIHGVMAQGSRDHSPLVHSMAGCVDGEFRGRPIRDGTITRAD